MSGPREHCEADRPTVGVGVGDGRPATTGTARNRGSVSRVPRRSGANTPRASAHGSRVSRKWEPVASPYRLSTMEP